MKLLYSFLLMGMVMLMSEQLHGQVYINEICSRNGNVLLDQNGSTPDWIELYNSSSSDANLSGWFLSTDRNNPQQWAFPGTTVPANGYRIVFCSAQPSTQQDPHTNFKLSGSGEFIFLTKPNGVIADSITVFNIPQNQSVGRQLDGEVPFVYYQTPTPRLTNNTVQGTPSYKTQAPVFSVQPGFYEEEVSFFISSPTSNATVFYTTNGSEPTVLSTPFEEPITISETAVIRALATSASLQPSDISSATYFINDKSKIPVISLITDSLLLFDEDTGIYMLGPNASEEFPYLGANFWSDTEVPVQVQMFEDDGNLVVNQTMGLQIHGGSISRTRPMRSLRLLARNSYGKKRVRHQLFRSKPILDFKRFLLRNSGSDYLKLGFRDGFIHNHLIKEKLNVDLGAYRPARVHINGQYWGIHNIREKYDRFYLEDNHGVDDKNVDLLEEQDQVNEGDFIAFDSMEQFILTNDLSQPNEYAIASSYFDTQNMVDYYAVETILDNADWPYNNLKYWRERVDGAKWRYIVFDLDVVLGGVSFIPVDFDNLGRVMGEYGDNNRHVLILRAFLKNPNFKQYFINRYNDLLNTTFQPTTMLNALDESYAVLEDELPRHWNRWNGTPLAFDEAYATISEHITQRPQHTRNQLKAVFDLGAQQTLSFNVFPEGAGTVNLNSLHLRSFPWSGLYHTGNEVSATAVPQNGNRFHHWELKGLEVTDDQVATLNFNPEENIELVAVFEGTFLGIDLSASPTPATSSINVSLVIPTAGNFTISLVDLTGKEVQRLYSSNTLPGRFKGSFLLNPGTTGVYLLQAKGQNFNKAIKVVVVPE